MAMPETMMPNIASSKQFHFVGTQCFSDASCPIDLSAFKMTDLLSKVINTEMLITLKECLI